MTTAIDTSFSSAPCRGDELTLCYTAAVNTDVVLNKQESRASDISERESCEDCCHLPSGSHFIIQQNE